MRHHIAIENVSHPCVALDIDKLPSIGELPSRKVPREDMFVDFEDLIAEECKDPEFKKAFDRGCLILDIAYHVVQTRKKLGLTQAELAQKAGTTQPVIARIEGGNSSRMPSLDLLAKIANAMGSEVKITFE